MYNVCFFCDSLSFKTCNACTFRQKFKHTLPHSNLKALSTCQTMECMSESTSIDFLCQLLLVSCFLTSITFKSYSYFDSSNIHTHAAIHITFHFLSPCCQCYPLVVQSLIFTQLLQHCMVSAVLFTSIFSYNSMQ